MKTRVQTKDLRQFGIILALVLAVVAFIQFRKGRESVYLWVYFFSGISLISGLILPKALYPSFKAMTVIAHALGWLNTRIILMLVYYAILTPIGLVMRVFRKDLLDARISKECDTYWKKRSVISPKKEGLEKQF